MAFTDLLFWRRGWRRGRRPPIGADFAPSGLPPRASPLDACPHLGLDRARTRAAWATRGHYCSADPGRVRRIALAYQEHVCLTASHPDCAFFLRALEEGPNLRSS